MYNRNLRKPSPNKNIYKFFSRKNRSTVMCESGLEFDACFHLEFSPYIAAFESQPQGIEYFVDVLFSRLFKPGFRYAKAGVMLTDFYEYGTYQHDLFRGSSELRHSKELMSVLD